LNKTTATQLKDGKFAVAGKGVMEASAGLSLVPTGAIQLTIGGDVLTLPATAVVPAKRSFSVKATELSATGIPAAGVGAATVYELPITLTVPTADGTNTFNTVIELKRASDATTKWAR